MRMVMDMQVEFSDEVLEQLAKKLPETSASSAADEPGKAGVPRLVLKFEKFGGRISLSSRAE